MVFISIYFYSVVFVYSTFLSLISYSKNYSGFFNSILDCKIELEKLKKD